MIYIITLLLFYSSMQEQKLITLVALLIGATKFQK